MTHNDLELADRDQQVLWHPCSQMKDYETFRPLTISGAKGSYLFTEQGHKIIDAISSWWCKNLGHGHPRLINALCKQAQQFEHVILANTTNHTIVNLSEKLTGSTKHLNKIFYASDGSCAVEIALKLAWHATIIKGQTEKNLIMSLSNGYHGETLFALAVSDMGLYRAPYERYLPTCKYLQSIPYVSSVESPNWHNCDLSWPLVETQLEKHQSKLLGIILEPIVQGAGGMLIYSQDFLAKLRQWCQRNDVYFIADEIMTGFGRTGKFFACEHANIEPDLLCLGKGVTSGMLPMSAVMMTDEIYNLFYNDYEAGHSFLHSHTHSGNVLAAAVALECLAVMEDEDVVERAALLETKLRAAMGEVIESTKCLSNLRGIGGIVAADLTFPQEGRYGYRIYQEAVKLGALLRPLGNTLYWLPPLTITDEEIEKLRDITIHAVRIVQREQLL